MLLLNSDKSGMREILDFESADVGDWIADGLDVVEEGEDVGGGDDYDYDVTTEFSEVEGRMADIVSEEEDLNTLAERILARLNGGLKEMQRAATTTKTTATTTTTTTTTATTTSTATASTATLVNNTEVTSSTSSTSQHTETGSTSTTEEEQGGTTTTNKDGETTTTATPKINHVLQPRSDGQNGTLQRNITFSVRPISLE